MKSHYDFFDKRKVSEIGLTVLSFVSIFIAVLLFAVSIYLFFSPIERVDMESVQRNSQVDCLANFNRNGFGATPLGENVMINKLSQRDHKKDIIQFDNIVGRCKNYVVNNFCYGFDGECQKDGLNSILVYHKPFEYEKEIK